jgi:glycosyltransferase involved in cell wall biosynthesis
MKFLLVNWTQIDELKGGCETIFSELSKIITEMGHETKMVSFNSAKRVLGIGLEKSSMGFFEAEASHIIDRYCSHYVKLFPETIIISNAGITNFWYKNPNTINIFNDPYRATINKLVRLGFYGATTLNKFGMICVKMQEKSAEGAKNIAISEFMANEMRKIGIEPYRIIPHGIDLELFKPMDKEELREKYNVPKDMTVAVWSKSFEPTSGFHIISNLVKKFKDIFWVLNFKNQQNYKPKAKNVLIVQPIEREKMPELYNLADLCINPSVAESFGLVPLEAMACGVPCILSNTGFVWEKDMEKDIEERTYGLLVNRWDTKAFSEAIEMMLEGKSKFRPREFAEKYNMEKWKSDWKEIINEPRIL